MGSEEPCCPGKNYGNLSDIKAGTDICSDGKDKVRTEFDWKSHSGCEFHEKARELLATA